MYSKELHHKYLREVVQNSAGVESRQQKKHLNLLPLSSWQLFLKKEDLDLERKLGLEQELLLTFITLGPGLLVLWLAIGFRFQVSTTTFSSIFITWSNLCPGTYEL